MRKVLRIDSNGFYIEDVILQDGKVTPTDCIEIICPDGFYKPKWNGTEWIEGLTQAEIDAIKNVVMPPTLEEQLATAQVYNATLNDTLNQFMDYVFTNVPNLPQ
jgi:hypothetical protein